MLKLNNGKHYSSGYFFFITSVAVIVFTICSIIVMIYVTRILRDMKHIFQDDVSRKRQTSLATSAH